MKIYAITYSFDNGKDYDMYMEGNGIINYYATKELAIEEFNKIDPQSVLDEYTSWMWYKDIEDYTLENKLNNYGLPDHFYNDVYEVGWFDYEVIEIDVIE